MSNKNVGIILLSSVLTFTAPSLFAQTNPEKPAKAAPTQPAQPAQRDMSSKSETMDKGAATQGNVKKAQQTLKDKGLYSGAVDGKMNPDFEAALKKYQTENQLEATGKLDHETIAKLGVGRSTGMKHEGMTPKEPAKEATPGKSTAPAKEKKGGKQGSMRPSEDVRQIQTALQTSGVDPGPIDGIMGPKTHKAIADFQRQKNLFASGQLDEKTKASLGVSGTTTMPSEAPTREKPTPVPPAPLPDNPPDRFPEPAPDIEHHSSINSGTLGSAQQPNIGLGTASSVEDIRLVQMALKNRGYDPGEINGIVGSQTQDAIRDFQARNNLPVTGILDDLTQAALGVNVKGTTNPDTKPPVPDESLNNTFGDDRSSNTDADIERAKPGPSAAVMEYSEAQTATTQTEPKTKAGDDKYAKSEKHNEKIDADLEKRVMKSTEVINALTSAGDKRIPNEILEKAQGIVVIPDMVKGAFGIGGRYGKGLVSKRADNGHWSAPAFVSIGGGSFGAQLGVSSTDVVLVFTDKSAFDALQKKMTLKLGADAAVAAGPIGRAAEAGVTHDLKSGIYAYSRSKGLFAGIALDGAVLDIDEDANHKMYGSNADTAAILSNPTMVSHGNVRTFVDALDRVAIKKMSQER